MLKNPLIPTSFRAKPFDFDTTNVQGWKEKDGNENH